MTIKYPAGVKRGTKIQIAIRFEKAQFDAIMKRAKHEKRTFNEMVEYLCQCGELCLSESDKHEEAA